MNQKHCLRQLATKCYASKDEQLLIRPFLYKRKKERKKERNERNERKEKKRKRKERESVDYNLRLKFIFYFVETIPEPFHLHK
jgi:hypothetical protein